MEKRSVKTVTFEVKRLVKNIAGWLDYLDLFLFWHRR